MFVIHDGSYNILGWSLGGIIAFEMVKQLEENNEVVDKFMLLDSYINLKLSRYIR